MSSSIENIKKVAEQGYAECQFILGVVYYYGEDGIEQDLDKAFYWFSKAAEQNYADAQRSLAQMYDHGEGVPKDLEMASYWKSKAAQKGHPEELFNLALRR